MVFKKIIKKKSTNLMKLFGVWKDNPEIVKIMRKIYRERKNFKLRDIKFD